MPVTFTSGVYPTKDKTKSKALSQLADFTGEFNRALVEYLKGEGIHDAQGFKLPDLPKALTLVKESKALITGKKGAELAVRAGLESNGNLTLWISGNLPAVKPGGPAQIYDKSVVIRKEFAKAVATEKSQANAVINLTKDTASSAGDKIINPNSAKQAAKFGTTAKPIDEADFGDLKSGNVVLCAHGGAAAVNGTVVGNSLGHKSSDDIVKLLTNNGSKAKSLSKGFNGTVILSGCFTAAGDGAIPSFAQEVHRKLTTAGYKTVTVKGMPGPSITTDSGDKAARHAMTTLQGAEAMLQRMGKLEDGYKQLLAKHGGDVAKAKADPAFAGMAARFKALKDERTKVLGNQSEDAKAAARIANIAGTFGLRVR